MDNLEYTGGGWAADIIETAKATQEVQPVYNDDNVLFVAHSKDQEISRIDLEKFQTPVNTITIDLASSNMSIALTDATPAHLAARLEWSDTLLGGKSVTYAAAQEAIAALGPGWRMPTRQELESLLDLSCHDPAIDTEKFPDTKSNGYWTSTPCAWNDAAVWVVDFYFGHVYGFHRNDLACVRAVRSGQ